MRATLSVLVIVLVAQLVFAAVLHLDRGESSGATDGPLITLDRAAIDALRITDSEGTSIQIKRAEDGWVLPGADGFPASAAKVERLLNNARKFADRLPVARSQASWRRFNVATDKFKRRIQFIVDGQPAATLLLGESAGPGRVYIRAKGQNMIYEAGFPLHYATTNIDQWLDRSVAGVSPREVRQVNLPDFSLRRDDQGSDWSVVRGGAQDVVAARADAVHEWLRRLAQPDFSAVANAERPETKPDFSYTLVTDDAHKIHYAFYAKADDGGGKDQPAARFYRTDQPWVYQVSADQLATLQQLGAKRFVAAPEPAGESGGGDRDGGSPGNQESQGSQGGASTTDRSQQPPVNAAGKSSAGVPTARASAEQATTSGSREPQPSGGHAKTN